MTAIDARTQVLLIDDDEHLRQALAQTLDLAGLRVKTLADARSVAERITADWAGVVAATSVCPVSTACSCWRSCTSRWRKVASKIFLNSIIDSGSRLNLLAIHARRFSAFHKNRSDSILESRALVFKQASVMAVSVLWITTSSPKIVNKCLVRPVIFRRCGEGGRKHNRVAKKIAPKPGVS